MWKDLEDRYGQTFAAQVYSFHTELFDIVQEPNMTISVYFTKIKSIWDQLDAPDPIPVCSCQGCACNLTKKVLKSQKNQRLIRFFNEALRALQSSAIQHPDDGGLTKPFPCILVAVTRRKEIQYG